MGKKEFDSIKKDDTFITVNCGSFRYVMFCRKLEYLSTNKGIVNVYPYCYVVILNNGDYGSQLNLVSNKDFFFKLGLRILSSSDEMDIRNLWYYVKKKVMECRLGG